MYLPSKYQNEINYSSSTPQVGPKINHYHHSIEISSSVDDQQAYATSCSVTDVVKASDASSVAVSGPIVWNNLRDCLRNPVLFIDILNATLKLSCLHSTNDDATAHWKHYLKSSQVKSSL